MKPRPVYRRKGLSSTVAGVSQRKGRCIVVQNKCPKDAIPGTDQIRFDLRPLAQLHLAYG